MKQTQFQTPIILHHRIKTLKAKNISLIGYQILLKNIYTRIIMCFSGSAELL